MGEQTILCGMLQTARCYVTTRWLLMVNQVIQVVAPIWLETITEALKQGGITLDDGRLSNPAKMRAYALSEQLKRSWLLFAKLHGRYHFSKFSETMMADWANDDKNLLTWREETEQAHLKIILNMR